MNKSYQNFKKRAGKLAVALTLAGATVVGGMVIGADAATYTDGNLNKSTALKASASTSSSTISTIAKNEVVRILGTSGNWYKVKYGEETGYVAKSSITNTYKITDCSYEVTTVKAFTVRKGAGVSFDKAGSIAQNKTVTVKGKTSNGWYLINYNGDDAYIPSGSAYVKYKINYTVTPCSYDVTTKIDLTVRQKAGQGYLSAGRLKAGTTLTVKGKTNNGWYEVEIDGITRYIPSGRNYVYKVSDNTAPTIACDSIIYLDQTEANQYTSNEEKIAAKAYDDQQGNITESIVYSGDTVDTSKPGTYNVKVSVTDFNNEVTEKNVQIIVKDSSAPEINVNNKYFVAIGAKIDLTKLGITAYDKEDGDLTSNISFSKGTIIDGTYIQQEGTSVLFDVSVKDKSGKETTVKDIELIFTSNTAPEVDFAKDSNGNEIRSITIDKGEKLTKSSLIEKLGVKGYDKKEGIIPIKDEYVSLGNYKDEVGDYYAYITIVYGGQKSQTEKVEIHVKAPAEEVKPVITYTNGQVKLNNNDDKKEHYNLEIPQYVEFNIKDTDAVTKYLGAVAKYTDPTTGRELNATLNYSGDEVKDELFTHYKITVTATYGDKVTTNYIDIVRTKNERPTITTVDASEAGKWTYVSATKKLTVLYGTSDREIDAILDKIVKASDDTSTPTLSFDKSGLNTHIEGNQTIKVTATDKDGAKSIETIINVEVVGNIK